MKKKFFWPILIALVFVISAYISKYWYQLILIQGKSMEPTYHNMQVAIMDKRIKVNEIGRGDVIAFNCENLGCILVKRVVGKPGDSVIIRDRKLYVNKAVSETFYHCEFIFAGLMKREVKLGKDEYLVIGDNIEESKDSRYDEVGIIKYEDIIGLIR